MSGPLRIALFAALLAILFGGALAAGSAVDPDIGESESAEHGEETGEHARALPQRGLAVAQDGLRLAASRSTFPRGRTREYTFQLRSTDGTPVTDFELGHERRMHVIVVRRDLTNYQHLHPRMAADGTWSLDLRLDEPGVYRVYADFERGDGPVTLATDLTVQGAYSAEELPEPATHTRADGYEIERAESGDETAFTVTRGGAPVDDVEPYLGARGHLVVLRQGDLAYLHVHPEDEATSGREIRFRVEYPTAGRYRMFLQFKHEGRVHTAPFTKSINDGDDD
jgi:hypothetical protein